MQYQIKRGDTLYKIASALTLDPAYYKAIANYNGIADPNKIAAGQVITIPDNWLKVTTAKIIPISGTSQPSKSTVVNAGSNEDVITAPVIGNTFTPAPVVGGSSMGKLLNYGLLAVAGLIVFKLLTNKKK